MNDRSNLAYGEQAEALWHAYQSMRDRQNVTDGKRQGARLVTNASVNVSARQWDVVEKLDRAYVRQGHAIARLFRAYTRTFESHPYVNGAMSAAVPVAPEADRWNTHATVAQIDAAMLAGERMRDATRDQSRDIAPDGRDARRAQVQAWMDRHAGHGHPVSATDGQMTADRVRCDHAEALAMCRHCGAPGHSDAAAAR
jgi:hypothetical protein